MELMIQSYEGQRAHNAMIDAIVAREIKKQNAERAEIEARKAEARSREMRELRMRLALSRAQNEKILNQLIMKDDRAYRPPEKRPVVDALWGLYGLAILIGGALADAARAVGAFIADALDMARGIRERMKRNRRAKRREAAKPLTRAEAIWLARPVAATRPQGVGQPTRRKRQSRRRARR